MSAGGSFLDDRNVHREQRSMPPRDSDTSCACTAASAAAGRDDLTAERGRFRRGRELERVLWPAPTQCSSVLGRMQGPQNRSSGLKKAYWRTTHSRVTWPPATFSTGKRLQPLVGHAVEMHEAPLASASTSVVGLSMPAIFISADGEFTAVSAPETLGT